MSRNSASIHSSSVLYLIGFLLSLLCTIAAYLLVVHHAFSKWTVALVIASLAAVQFIVQLVFFLRLGSEARPKWKLVVFGFMMTVVAILVIGSLWIMYNLSYHHMPSATNTDTYLHEQDGGI
jgi:cytochrome o ubiquinol oxidase operon protein cyoD